MQTRSIIHVTWMLLGSKALAYAMVACFVVFACLVNFPGHLSLDSLVQLSEGRSGNFVSFNPPFASVLIALFDRIHPGTGLLMIFNITMFGLALILMVRTLPRTNPLSNLLLLAMLASPITVIYNGIIWKDVMFANFALLAFSLLLVSEQQSSWGKTLLIIVLLAMASLIRQQGIIVALIASLAMPFVLYWRQQSSWVSRIGLGIGTFLAIITLSKLLFILATLGTSGANSGAYSTPISLLMLYDIAGVIKHKPGLSLPIFEQVGISAAAFKAMVLANYTPQRIDTMDWFSILPATSDFFSLIPQQWRQSIQASPSAYLAHRLEVFSWQLGCFDHTKCAPVYVGIETSGQELLRSLTLSQTSSRYSGQLWGYASQLFDSPVFTGAWYLLAQMACVAILCLQRLKRHKAVIGLGIAAILFTLSYLLVGIACDLRYIYFMIVSSMFCIVYTAAQIKASNSPAT